MAFADTWDASFEATPADSEARSLGASRIRQTRVAVQERGEVDHSWAGDADDGKHKQVTFVNPLAGDPSNVADQGFLYTKNISTKAELFWEDEDGNVLQITSGGVLITSFNLVDDVTPQAGADIDMNSFDIQFDDAKGIRDDSDNEQLIFQKTASAVNHMEHTNAAAGNEPSLAAVGGDTDIDLNLISKGTGVIQSNGTAVGLTGKHAIYIPVSAMEPEIDSGCSALTLVQTTAGNPDLQVRDFSTSADERALFGIAMPKSWNEGTVTFQAIWTHAGGQDAGKDGVAWFLQGLATSNDDSADQNYGTAVVKSQDGVTAEDIYITDVSDAITLSGTPIENDFAHFRVGRDVSHTTPTPPDDLTIDARLIGIRLFITFAAGNDA